MGLDGEGLDRAGLDGTGREGGTLDGTGPGFQACRKEAQTLLCHV